MSFLDTLASWFGKALVEPDPDAILFSFAPGFPAQYKEAILGAIQQASAELNLKYALDNRVGSSRAGIVFHWWPPKGKFGTWPFKGVAVTEPYEGGTTYIRIDARQKWHIGLPISQKIGNDYIMSLDMAMLHELGHAHGIAHAPFSGTVMEPSLSNIHLYPH